MYINLKIFPLFLVTSQKHDFITLKTEGDPM